MWARVKSLYVELPGSMSISLTMTSKNLSVKERSRDSFRDQKSNAEQMSMRLPRRLKLKKKWSRLSYATTSSTAIVRAKDIYPRMLLTALSGIGVRASKILKQNEGTVCLA